MAVYFIQNIDTGHIKIGKSFMVLDRLKALEKREGCHLRLLGVIKGYSTEETDLHLHFDEIRLHGEWFDNASELIEFIKTHSVSLVDLDETPPILSTVIKSNIKDLAQEQGYKTPEALSKKMHLSINTVMNIWTGDVSKRQFATMFAVAKLLNVRMEDLVAINE